MNRGNYFNYIEEKLSTLALRIETRGKINLLDLHIYSETFFADMLNLLYGYHLKNLNGSIQNAEGIDLVDDDNMMIAQVSATCTKKKVEASLGKKIYEQYKGYRFKFVSISKDAGKLREMEMANPNNVLFQPMTDIIDMKSIETQVLTMKILKQREFYEFIKEELGNEIDIVKVDSNLAAILSILAKENLSVDISSPEINSFAIESKIRYNDLLSVQDIISDYAVYYKKLNEKYTEFDKQGVNKSLSVLSLIRNQYIRLSAKNMEAHELFFSVIENIIDMIQKSKNYVELPYEELEMCVYIIVVDAFIKCKIFKNPEGYCYVTP